VTLQKPLGVVLEESKDGIYVAEVQRGGNAERNGEINVGDMLISTSAWITTNEQTYGETRVPGGEERVKMAVRGQSFDSVMAAIGTHKAHQEVTLEFQRCVIAGGA